MRAVTALLAACTYAYPTDTAAPEDGPVPVEALWEGDAPSGTITLEPVVIVSPRSTTGTHAFAQRPGGGDRSGLRLEIPTIHGGFPPAVGTTVQLTGTWSTGSPPRLVVDAPDDVVALGAPVEPVATPWNGDDALGGSLVALVDITVTSGVDPAGHADTDGPLALDGAFGVTPGFGASGDAVGVLTDGGVSLRSATDWTGTLDGLPPVPVSIADVKEATVAEGTWVVLTDVVQATPWSTDGRWTVVQDGQGVGLWIDAEGWGTAATGEGDLLDAVGEARVDRLRTWVEPEVIGQAPPLFTDALVDGALVQVDVNEVGPVQPDGSRVAGELVLDGRFTDLSTLAAPARVTGVVRGEAVVAVTAWE